MTGCAFVAGSGALATVRERGGTRARVGAGAERVWRRSARVVRMSVETSEERAAGTRRMSVEERVAEELMRDGIELEQLLSPAKLIELERKIEEKMEALDDAETEGATKDAVRKEIEELRKKAATERRMVMQDWLKTLFGSQGVLGIVAGGVLAYGGDAATGHNPLSALLFNSEPVPLVARVLGFWLIWMFTIPSLRARKPLRTEKAALNTAFVALPLANVLAPFVTKDPFVIWSADVALLALCYAFYFVFKLDPADSPKLRGALRWLDWGSWR
mmetsp:Transcript_12021/g.32379  ORF Transcript_12021/g.32379 Transcript_12021/m.32379 type:complete len:274 (+) Transcript_12021:64-885(+)